MKNTSSQKNIPRKLYHGTNSVNLAKIMEAGLCPREVTGTSQWDHTVVSRHDMVYLTSAYPLHFAANAEGEGVPIIVEVDTALLVAEKFVADEDALALTRAIESGGALSTDERVEYFKEHSHKYSASLSLELLGNCAYQGQIPVSAITRIIRIPVKSAAQLIMGGMDPVISPFNYKFLGKEYEAGVAWLMGDVPTWVGNERLVRPAIEIIWPPVDAT